MNRVLEYLDRALDHVGRFLHRELEVPIYWKALFIVQLVIQTVLMVPSFVGGQIPLLQIGMIIGFGLLAVAFAQEPRKNRAKWCRSCGSPMLPREYPMSIYSMTINVCPNARPNAYELLTASPRVGISCDEVEFLPPLYHTPHDPNMPDIDCVPCLLRMAQEGAITGKEVDKRIKRLMAAYRSDSKKVVA